MNIDIAKLTQITQLVALTVGTIAQVEEKHRGNPDAGPVKKEEVETILGQAIAVAEASGKLSISDHKGFNKDTSHIIDGIVGWTKKSEWK